MAVANQIDLLLYSFLLLFFFWIYIRRNTTMKGTSIRLFLLMLNGLMLIHFF